MTKLNVVFVAGNWPEGQGFTKTLRYAKPVRIKVEEMQTG